MSARGRAKRARNDLGATMVEAAIAGGVFFLLFFMIVQAAMFGRTYLAARDAATAGSRAGAVAASDSFADYQILQAVRKSVSATSLSAVEAVVIFNPQGNAFVMPAGCTTGGVSGMCNFYTASDLKRPVTDFTNGTFSAAESWPAAQRSTSINSGLGHIGVYVKLEVDGMVGPLPKAVSISNVVEIEPHS